MDRTVKVYNFNVMCRRCGENKKNSEMANIIDKKYTHLCKNCAERNGFNLCHCGNYYAGNCLCGHKKDKNKIKIEEYNFTGKYEEFKLNKDDNMLFGIEIELEFKDSSYDNLKDLNKKDWLFFKRDGSLQNGVEIVTMPLGYEWMQANKNDFKDIFHLAELKMKSKLTRTCGMHVHIPKNIFTDKHLEEFNKFIQLNQEFIIYISERHWDTFTRWASFIDNRPNLTEQERLNVIKIIKKQAKRKDNAGQDRHSAVNLINPQTVEIRIFKGSLSSYTFWKNIEFIRALYFFSKESENQSIDAFNKYVNIHKEEFSYLYDFISDNVKEEILGR